MNKKQLNMLQLAALSIPFIPVYMIGVVLTPGEWAFAFLMLFIILLFWPIILITGGIVNRLTKNSQNAAFYSIVGYMTPALLILIWMVAGMMAG